jgi:hypothetical protein
MALQSWLLLALILCLFANSAFSWWHARWFDRKRAEWIASNDELIAALRELAETNSQEGDEVR